MNTLPRFIGWQDTTRNFRSRPTRTGLFNVPFENSEVKGETTLTYQTMFRNDGDRWQYINASVCVRYAHRRKYFLCELLNGFDWSDSMDRVLVFAPDDPKAVATVTEILRKCRALSESRFPDAYSEFRENGLDPHLRFKQAVGKEFLKRWEVRVDA